MRNDKIAWISDNVRKSTMVLYLDFFAEIVVALAPQPLQSRWQSALTSIAATWSAHHWYPASTLLILAFSNQPPSDFSEYAC